MFSTVVQTHFHILPIVPLNLSDVDLLPNQISLSIAQRDGLMVPIAVSKCSFATVLDNNSPRA